MTEFSISRGMLTPELAAALLAKNSKNRRLVAKRVNNLANAIKQGHWIFDGNPIKLSVNDDMLDGQHRCAAVVQAGIAVETVIISGMQDDAIIVMDSGKARSFTDYLTVLGIPSATHVGNVCRFIWNIENGRFPPRQDGTWREIPDADNKTLHDFFLAHEEELREAGRKGDQARQRAGCIQAAAACAWYHFKALDYEDAQSFFKHLATGEDLQGDDPILALRRAVNRGNTARPKVNYHQYALMVKAWNAWREGRAVKVLVWKGGGNGAEKMPTPV